MSVALGQKSEEADKQVWPNSHLLIRRTSKAREKKETHQPSWAIQIKETTSIPRTPFSTSANDIRMTKVLQSTCQQQWKEAHRFKKKKNASK